MKSLMLERTHPDAITALQGGGLEVRAETGSLEEEKLIAALQGVEVLGIRSRTQVTQRVLEHAPDLVAIGAYCIGVNQIDLATASLQGVAVFHAPYSNTRSVAEMVIAEIIFLLRRLHDKIVGAHQGVWEKSAENAREVRGKKLGIVGYGNIGSQVSALAEGLGMDVYYFDIVDKLTIGNATRIPSIDELLRIADVITIHVDGSPENRHLIGAPQIAMMKPGALLLNLSRGHVVDVEALAEAIRSGKIAGVAVDVYPDEPKNASERLVTPLQGLPNVLLTPHVGGSTEEAQENIAQFVSGKLLDYMRNGNTFVSVNFPRITAPRLEGAHRILHVHRNVPGVLSHINGIFAQNNVNVLSQYLRTNETIGYVIADVDKEYREGLYGDLQKVENTIRVRIV